MIFHAFLLMRNIVNSDREAISPLKLFSFLDDFWKCHYQNIVGIKSLFFSWKYKKGYNQNKGFSIIIRFLISEDIIEFVCVCVCVKPGESFSFVCVLMCISIYIQCWFVCVYSYVCVCVWRTNRKLYMHVLLCTCMCTYNANMCTGL